MFRLMARVVLFFTLTATLALAQNARVRFVNGSSDTPGIDIYLDGKAILAGIPFGDYSDYVTIPTGQHSLSAFTSVGVTPPGTTSATNKLADVSINLSNGADYTAVAYGYGATPTKTPSFKIAILQDNNAVPGDQSASVRFINLSSVNSSLDVYATSPFQILTGKSPTFAGIPLGSASNYVQIPANTQESFQVTTAGSTTAILGRDRTRFANNGLVRTIVAVDNIPATTTPPTTVPANQSVRLIELADRNF